MEFPLTYGQAGKSLITRLDNDINRLGILPRDPGGPTPVAQGLQLTLHAVSDGFGPLGDLAGVIDFPTQLFI